MPHNAIVNGIPVKDKIEAQILKVGLMKEIIKPTKPHRHADYHELILLSQGTGFHEVDDATFEVFTPVAYYLRPGQTHCWNFSSVPKGFVILFREELLLKEDVEVLYTLSSQILLKDEQFLFSIAKEFFEEFKFKNAGAAVYRAYLHFLITKLKQAGGRIKGISPVTDNLFQKYKRLVNDNYLQKKQLNFYVGQLNITTSVLNGVCKKAVGRTALTIINERLLLEAKILLSATSKAINEIAGDLQFSDASHFVKFFKVHTNLTPLKYRELALGKE